MRVCLTGGAGFIGRAAARRLVAQGHDVVAIDVLNPQVHVDPDRSVADFPGQVIVGDIRHVEMLQRAVSGCQVVIHLAAETGVAQSMYQEEHYLSVNVGGSEQVARTAADIGAALIALSSRAVYGQGAYRCTAHGRSETGRCCEVAEPDASRETDACLPVSVYGESKRLAELAMARVDIPLVIVRPQNVVGAGQAPHNPYTGVLSGFAARIAAGLAPQVYGSGEQTRDFVDVDDVAHALTWMTQRVGNTGAIPVTSAGDPVVNLGSGVRTTLNQLAAIAIAAAYEDSPEPLPEPEHVAIQRPGDIDHACADLTRAIAVGVPQPTIPLHESVRSFLESAAGTVAADPAMWERALAQLPASEP